MPNQRTLGKVMPIEKKWLTPEEAKKYLGCKDDFLRNLREKSLISFSRFGRNMFWYELRSLERFLERNKVV